MLLLISDYQVCAEVSIEDIKKVLLKISQISQENICVGVSFNKVAGLKKRLQQRCFPVKFCEIFKNTYFEEHLRKTTSIYINGNVKLQSQPRPQSNFLKVFFSFSPSSYSEKENIFLKLLWGQGCDCNWWRYSYINLSHLQVLQYWHLC